MSLHKLSAGDGYKYLTRQVAAAHDTNRGYGTLGAYYEEKGESPGVWMGSGLGSCPSIVPDSPLLAAGGRVSEAQMVALFGEGRHPDADVIERRLMADGVRGRELDRATRLGQKFPVHETPNVFRERLTDQYREHNERLGLPPGAPVDGDIRAKMRTALGREMFTEQHHRAPSDPRELSGFLARASRPAPKAVAGYDLTFSPVKSVSTLWAIAPTEVSEVVAACHQEAVADAIGWLEKTACFTRRGAGGVAQVDTTGFVAAAFTHRDSRAGDPDLHTHVAVSNKVCTPTGDWLALDGRALFKNKVAASERYNTRLEALLVDRLGVRFADRPGDATGKRAVREIVGIDGELPQVWSARRASIETALGVLTPTFQADHGRPPMPVETRKLAQQATLATRDSKHAPRLHADQRATWHREAIDVLGSEKALRHYVGAALSSRRDVARVTYLQVDVAEVALSVLETVQSERATWQANHVRAEAERRARTLAVPLQAVDRFVDQVVEQVLSPALSVALNPPSEIVEPGVLRRADGVSVYDIAGSHRYTSTAILGAERFVLDLAGGTGARAASPTAVGVALLESAANGITLDPDQAVMVRELATSGARVQLALAPAGTGKTVTLRVLADAWTNTADTTVDSECGSVVGLAPSAAAAALLREELGSNAVAVDTLAKLVHATRTGQSVPEWVDGIGPQTLVIIDEAGMAGTLELAAAVRFVTGRGACVRLVGDDQQLAAVGAGGLLRDIARTHGLITLSQVRRFTHPDGGINHGEAAASAALRNGDPAGIAYYTDHARIHVGDRTTTVEQAYQAWAVDRAAGLDAVLLAPTRDLVVELNVRARTERLATYTDEPVGRSVVLGDGTRASAGDTIISRRNDRCLALGATDWVTNGDRWTIQRVESDGALTVRHLATHRRLTLPADYVTEHVTLGYATTIHGAQGLTADTCHTVATGEETRQVLYVALTRGRRGNHLYLDVTTGTDPHALTDPDAIRPPTAGEILTRVLSRDGAAVSATTEAEALREPATLLRAAVAQYLDAIGVAAESVTGTVNLDRLDIHPEQLLPGLTDAPAWPALKARLMCLGLDDTDPDLALRAAIDAAPLTGADDIAAVLTWRIDHTTTASGDAADVRARPLPWLTPVPRQLTDDHQWGRYFDRRDYHIARHTQAVTAATRGWDTTTAPPWALPLVVGGQDPELVADLAVWRACHDVADTDLRPTGPPQPGAGSEHAQQALNARVTQITETGTGTGMVSHAKWRRLANAINPYITADPGWPALTAQLTTAAAAGYDTVGLLLAAGCMRPLPDEQPAAAIIWRIRYNTDGLRSLALYRQGHPKVEDSDPAGDPTGLRIPGLGEQPAHVAGQQRWADLLETIRPGLSTDPHQVPLVRHLDRAAASGWNVDHELPTLAITPTPLDSPHAGRDLDYRLAAACPSSRDPADYRRQFQRAPEPKLTQGQRAQQALRAAERNQQNAELLKSYNKPATGPRR